MRILARTLGSALLVGAVAAGAAEGGAKRGPADVDGDGRVTVVCFGDSTTKGDSLLTAYPARLRAHLSGQAEIVNAGKSGDRGTNAVERLRSVLDRRRADHVILLLGVKDVLDVPSREACAARATDVVGSIRAMVAEVRRRGAVPVVGTVFVSPSLGGGLPTVCARRINAEIRRLPERRVDFAWVMHARYDRLTEDGVHPNEAGAEALAVAVTAALEPPAPGESGPPDVNGDGRTVIICLGDSVTAGGVYGSYPAILRERLPADIPVVNAGNYGDSTARAKARLGALLDDAPDYVLVELGTNDLGAVTTDEGCAPAVARATENLRAIADEVRRRGAMPFLATVFSAPERRGGVPARCAAKLNTWIRAQPEGRLDFEAALHGRLAELTLDGIHPNRKGLETLAETAVRALGVDGSAGR